jgi:hypothetical protein
MIEIHFHFPEDSKSRPLRMEAVPRPGDAVRVGLSTIYRVEGVEWRLHEPVHVYLRFVSKSTAPRYLVSVAWIIGVLIIAVLSLITYVCGSY